MIPTGHALVFSALLFCIGLGGVLLRRNAIVVFMSIELMLNAVNLSFMAFSKYVGNSTGQVFVFFIMAVAAAEVAVGLAIIIVLYKGRETVNVDEVDLMKW